MKKEIRNLAEALAIVVLEEEDGVEEVYYDIASLFHMLSEDAAKDALDLNDFIKEYKESK